MQVVVESHVGDPEGTKQRKVHIGDIKIIKSHHLLVKKVSIYWSNTQVINTNSKVNYCLF